MDQPRESLRFVHTATDEGSKFEIETDYGVRIVRRLEITFEVRDGFPGSNDLCLYLEMPSDAQGGVEFWKFIELTLRRVHHSRGYTMDVTLDMLWDASDRFLAIYPHGLYINFQDPDVYFQSGHEIMKQMVCDANECVDEILCKYEEGGNEEILDYC